MLLLDAELEETSELLDDRLDEDCSLGLDELETELLLEELWRGW